MQLGTPWDIYVDERKDGGRCLGFLVVPNTPSFMHKLFKARHVKPPGKEVSFRASEVHWHKPRGDTVWVAREWMYRVFQHRGARFVLKPWPNEKTKEVVILEFIAEFCREKGLAPPFNVVVFLDFDSSHAKAYVQNMVRESGRILRCYHLDSRNNDCIQCCDLMLGATALCGDDPTVRFEYEDLDRRLRAGNKLKDSEIKLLLAGHLARLIDSRTTSVYDLRCQA